MIYSLAEPIALYNLREEKITPELIERIAKQITDFTLRGLSARL